MSNSTLEHKLAQLLANSYSLLLMSQDLHWNYTGPEFFSLHTMSQKHYEALFAAIDDIAEHMRTKGMHVPVGLDVYHKMRTVTASQLAMASHGEFLKHLIQSYEETKQTLEELQSASQEAGDVETEDMAVEMLRLYAKHHWMLQASLS